MKKILLAFSLIVSFMGMTFAQSTIWKPYDINVDTSWGIRYLNAVDSNIVWGIAYDGSDPDRNSNIFVRTSNGANFKKGTFLADTNTYSASNICALDSLTAYIGIWPKVANTASGNPTGISSKVIKTIDGGLNWTSVSDSLTMFNGVTNFIDFVYFWDKNNGLALGDPNGNTSGGTTARFEIWRTHNGGTNWARVADANIPVPASGETGFTNSFATLGKRIWFGTATGRVYASADSGQTWSVSTGTAILKGGVQGLAFRDSLNGIGWGLVATTSTANSLIKTTNGGKTWTKLIPDATNTGLNAFCAVPGSSAYMSVGINTGKSAYVTSITSDDGATWDLLESGTASAFRMIQVQMLDSTHGWAGTFSDTTQPLGKNGMDKYIGPKIQYTGITKILNPNDIGMYPNPSKGLVNITMSKVDLGTTVSVTDMIGKEVYKTKVNSMDMNLNLSGLQTGMYIITISNGKSAYMQKLIIE